MSIVTLAAINTLLFLRTARALRSLHVVAFSPSPSFSFPLSAFTPPRFLFISIHQLLTLL